MIYQVKITNNKKSHLKYLVDVFKNGNEFNFKPGINIIIGPNGSGKSTLLNLIKHYTLCKKQHSSEFYSDIIDFSDYYDYGKTDLLDGVDVLADYKNSVFNFMHSGELKTNDDRMRSIENLTLFYNSNHVSTGQSVIGALSMFFKKIFSDKVNLNFPLNELKDKIGEGNDLWTGRFQNLLNYIEKNTVSTEESPQYTILMDEPDRNLDIDNANQIYHVVKTRKPNTQLLCVIHNPILINRLSKLDYINFIEMEKGYLDKVLNFVNQNP